MWFPLPDNQPPPAVQIGALVDRVMRTIGAPVVDDTTRILNAWPELAGPVAPHARAAGIRDGTLTVNVDGPAYADHIRWAEPDLLQRLDELAPGVITSIKAVQTRK